MRHQQIPAVGTSFALYVATCIFQLLFLERGASLYDEGSIIAMGVGLSHGEILYRDRLTFVAPFTYELIGALYRVFDPHILVGRAFLIFAFATVVVLVHRIFLKLLAPGAALLGALAIWPIKPLGFPLWSILNYSQVALLFKVAALWAAVNWFRSRRRGWLLATGMLVGLTLVAKQDFGGYIALAVTVAVGFDWWIRPPRRVSHLVRTLLSLGLMGAIPLVVAFLYYAAHGAGLAFIDRTVFDLVAVPGEYGVPFPGFRPWSQRPDDLFMLVFAYFPAVFIELAWAAKINVYDRAQLLPLEIVIKTAYYLPGLAMAALLVAAVRGRRGATPAQRSSLVLIAGVATVAYTLIFRADWIHLMNLYAIVVLPVTIALGRWSSGGRAWRRLPGAAVWLVWIGFGAVTTYAICTVYTAPIDSQRGRLLDVPRKAGDIVQVLDYVAGEPAEHRVLFLPHIPLFYFLTGRPILAPNDLIMPGLIAGDEDDRRLASAVAEVDLVIYNPKIFPTAPAPLYAYAPRTAAVLASRFATDGEINNAAIVLRRMPGQRPAVVVDLWSATGLGEIEPLRGTQIWSDEIAAAAPPVVREHWMVYRVVTVRTAVEGVEQCFERRHCARDGETLTAMPITHPEGWGAPPGALLQFEIRATASDETATIFSGARVSSDVPTEISVALQPWAGQCVELQFCATAIEAGVPRGVAGWAEPRVETAAAEPPSAIGAGDR
jgi:hypothetical protein